MRGAAPARCGPQRPAAGHAGGARLRRAALHPAVAAGTEPVVVIAARLGAVSTDADSNRSTPAAAFARTTMAIRREVGRLNGHGGHASVYHVRGAVGWVREPPRDWRMFPARQSCQPLERFLGPRGCPLRATIHVCNPFGGGCHLRVLCRHGSSPFRNRTGYALATVADATRLERLALKYPPMLWSRQDRISARGRRGEHARYCGPRATFDSEGTKGSGSAPGARARRRADRVRARESAGAKGAALMTMLPAQGTAWRRVELPDVPPPPDPQEVARRDAERARLKAEFDAIDWDVAQAATFERIRDRRPLAPIRKAWHAVLLHRANPDRYPRTPALREWIDHTLIDLIAAERPHPVRHRFGPRRAHLLLHQSAGGMGTRPQGRSGRQDTRLRLPTFPRCSAPRLYLHVQYP